MSELRPLRLLLYPYNGLTSVTQGTPELLAAARRPGSALIWVMGNRRHPACAGTVAERPGGLPLLIILPPGEELAADGELMDDVQRGRPHSILPFHRDLTSTDLAEVLRRPPADLGAEVADYLRWRGIRIDRDTARLVRRIIDLSAELRSVAAVSRGLYLSRRALGRRLMSCGLPVPSHWLHLGRLLRVSLKLQNSDATVSSVAFDLGYPDGFSVSNQMERLIGFRPSYVRGRLGWEWIVEAWLRREAERGGLTPTLTRQSRGPAGPVVATLGAPRPRRRPRKSPQSDVGA